MVNDDASSVTSWRGTLSVPLVLACLILGLSRPGYASVTGIFYETACFLESPAGPSCPGLLLPAALGQFSSSDNSGSYSFVEAEGVGPIISGDDNFSFSWEGPSDFSAPPSDLPCFHSSFISECVWNVTWTASSSSVSVEIHFHGDQNANIDIGNGGGMIGSDGIMPGCGMFAECDISGYWDWSSSFRASGPSSVIGLATSIFMMVLILRAELMLDQSRNLRSQRG